VDADLSNWAKLLPAFEIAYNTTPHSVTGFTPFYLVHGYEARLPKLLNTTSRKDQIIFEKDYAKEFIDAIQARRQMARNAILLAQQDSAFYYNKTCSFIELNVGDFVWINAKELELTGDYKAPGSKLRFLREGPYKIIEKISPIVFKIRLPVTLGISPIMNIDKLEKHISSPGWAGIRAKPYDPRRPHSHLKDEEVAYIIAEKFIQKRGRKALHYMAVWTDKDGNQYEDNVWVPAKNFTNAPEVVAQWKDKQVALKTQPPSEPKPITPSLVAQPPTYKKKKRKLISNTQLRKSSRIDTKIRRTKGI
jgi:hypothetical protein